VATPAKKEVDELLARFRKLPKPVRIVYGRPRTFVAFAIGIVAFLLLPDSLRLVTRLLIGWDAILQDDGSILILLIAALGAFASIAAIVFELGQGHRTPWELGLATATIALSWAAVHTIFALHYAHDYYRGAKPGGLTFPAGDKPEDPDYWDFVYFSFVVGMTAQVSDVGITTKGIRRTATAHGIVSFIYNTALVALMVNIAASAI
jgi:uncharacterized membrane protein